jgi:hemerythrin-like domain-containing protein
VDIFDLLKQDHQQISEMLRAIERNSEDERKELFDEMQTELMLHSEAEETVFYSELEKHDALRELVLEGREEHKLFEQLLEDMSAMESGDEQWLAKLTVLNELVSHHVQEEEKCLFPKAQDVVDADLGAELAERFEEEKENLRAEVSA